MRSHVGWGGEPLHSRRVLKTLRESPKRTILASDGLGQLQIEIPSRFLLIIWTYEMYEDEPEHTKLILWSLRSSELCKNLDTKMDINCKTFQGQPFKTLDSDIFRRKTEIQTPTRQWKTDHFRSKQQKKEPTETTLKQKAITSRKMADQHLLYTILHSTNANYVHIYV